MVGHGGSSAGSYIANPTSPIPSHCASIVVTSTLRVKPHPIRCSLYHQYDHNTPSIFNHTTFPIRCPSLHFLQILSFHPHPRTPFTWELMSIYKFESKQLIWRLCKLVLRIWTHKSQVWVHWLCPITLFGDLGIPVDKGPPVRCLTIYTGNNFQDLNSWVKGPVLPPGVMKWVCLPIHTHTNPWGRD